MRARWPKQQRLIAQLRDILQREFGCRDAWVVVSGRRCRLEVHIGGQRITLLEDAEDAFWARFYAPVQKERLHLGERVVETQIWRRTTPALVAVLTPYWDRVGPRQSRRGPGLDA
jgi:phosphatidylserine/phosphatidylglycerophosphate/cardiolipin synthase-like enzyme